MNSIFALQSIRNLLLHVKVSHFIFLLWNLWIFEKNIFCNFHSIFGCHKYFKKHKLDGLTDVKIHMYGVITCATI